MKNFLKAVKAETANNRNSIGNLKNLANDRVKNRYATMAKLYANVDNKGFYTGEKDKRKFTPWPAGGLKGIKLDDTTKLINALKVCKNADEYAEFCKASEPTFQAKLNRCITTAAQNLEKTAQAQQFAAEWESIVSLRKSLPLLAKVLRGNAKKEAEKQLAEAALIEE